MWSLGNKVETYAVIDAEITVATMGDAIEAVKEMAGEGEKGYICFVNAHVSVMTRQDECLRNAINGASFAFPDGMPVYWAGRYLWGKRVEKISGPDFMRHMFDDAEGRKLRHYFYGGKPSVVNQLILRLKRAFPGCQIVGAESPPFRPLSEEEQQQAVGRMLEAQAQLVWVGLGAPKQELWMQRNYSLLNSATLLGVGAAFDFHAGTIVRAPPYMRKLGMEWLHRLLQEPGRLWKRYLLTNSLFLLYTAVDCVKQAVFKKNR